MRLGVVDAGYGRGIEQLIGEQLGRMEGKLDDIRARLEDLARRHDVQRESSKSRLHITITNEREQALGAAHSAETRCSALATTSARASSGTPGASSRRCASTAWASARTSSGST